MLKSAVLSLLALGLAMPALGIAGAAADIAKLEQDFNAAYAANQLDRYFAFYTDSDVWFKTDAGWKITHVHYSAVPKPKKPLKKA